MKVLVTGAGGFSGAEIARALLAAGHEVFATTGSSAGRLAEIGSHNSLRAIPGDLAAGIDLPPVDAIVHAAARSPAPGTETSRMVHDNVVGTLHLAEHARRASVQKFVFLSSLSIYGTITTPIVDENTPINDPDPYGLSKLACERILQGLKGISILAIRLPGVIGQNSVRNWLTGVLDAAREGREIQIYNADGPFNNAAHVLDLAQFVCELLLRTWKGFEAVPIGASGQTTVRRAVEIILAGIGSGSSIKVKKAPQHGFLISSDRARAHGYRPMDIEAMLERFAVENRD